MNAFTQGLGPMLYGAAKGTAASIAGMPGDIEQLARQLLLSGAAPDSYTAKNMAAQALLPTSDRVRAMLPSLPGAGPQAQYSENMGATLGQNVVGNLVAPKALPAVIRAGQDLPVGASIKAVDNVAPQSEALRLAQQRAALPVEQGGLGLLESNTAMDRAKAMGAEDVYHGTNAEKQILNDLKFNLDADQRNVGGIWTTKDKNYASWLANQKDRNNANVMSLKLLNAKNSYEYDILQEGIKLADEIGVPIPKNPLEAQKLLSGGYGWDRVVGDLLSESKSPNLKITNFNDAYHSNPNEVTTAFITKDPSLLRLSNAAFDPFRRTAATAAAMGVAAPDLLAAQMSVADQIDNINEVLKKKRKK